MFRISKPRYLAPEMSQGAHDSMLNDGALEKYCATDAWSGDLSNGLFQLGGLSEQLHGLPGSDCGLLTLLRCYEESDRIQILELLEAASASASSFCFSTHIASGPASGQPVICVGHSSGFGEDTVGRMHGVFIFPRMHPEAIGH